MSGEVAIAPDPDHREVTQLLADLRDGDQSAADALLPLVYDELRRLARARMNRLPAGQTLQPTALVHEAYMKLVDDRGDSPAWDSRAHFFSAAAQAMRNILVDHARRKAAVKRGGDRDRAPLHDADAAIIESPADDMLALDEALRGLDEADPRAHEIVMLRYFAGLSEEQTAASLGLSPRTIRRDWAYARAWLQRAMSERNDHPDGDGRDAT